MFRKIDVRKDTSLLILVVHILRVNTTVSECPYGTLYLDQSATCYWFVEWPVVNAFKAYEICHDTGGTMLEVSSPEEQTFIEGHAMTGVDYWLGLFKFNGGFAWLGGSGSPVEDGWSNWYGGGSSPPEPNDYGWCVDMRHFLRKWGARSCYYKIGFICEYQDTPCIPDNTCLNFKTNSTGHQGNEPSMYTFGDTCYIIYDDMKTAFQAHVDCGRENWSLLKIDDQLEQEFIESVVDSRNYWIGLLHTGLGFYWVNRGKLTNESYVNWIPSGNDTECMQLNRGSGWKWTLTSCSANSSYICEMQPYTGNFMCNSSTTLPLLSTVLTTDEMTTASLVSSVASDETTRDTTAEDGSWMETTPTSELLSTLLDTGTATKPETTATSDATAIGNGTTHLESNDLTRSTKALSALETGSTPISEARPHVEKPSTFLGLKSEGVVIFSLWTAVSVLVVGVLVIFDLFYISVKYFRNRAKVETLPG
ncbi:secretory phospholipase A2 receptor-like [Ptychodera flava]|uniref:secretory phospholipase A2 receptor-like n=1 Tax=Ptychodera flava TaxID=63121 RepID=UPI00396A6C43